MNNSYILVDKVTNQIRVDKQTRCLLIFDEESDAIRHLSKVKPKKDKESTIIVSKFLRFE